MNFTNHIIIVFLSFFVACFITGCNNDEDPIILQEQIPNADFENWSKDDYNFDKPQTWATSNFSLYGIVNFNPVFKDSVEKFSGNYCVKLQTKSQYINTEVVKVAGLLTLGDFDINIATRKAQVTGGIQFSARPKSLTGYYKYKGVNNDKCYIDVALMKKGEGNLSGDTIATGRFSSLSINSWTFFEAPIVYVSDLQPEILNIIVLSSDTSIFVAGSTLWIDNLSFKY